MQVPITAIVTAYQRIEQTLVTLEQLKNCCPAPAEILVHVDGGQRECELAINKKFPEIKVILSEDSVGPGGGRNKLIAIASYDVVASFDDDSYPLDADYFERVLELFNHFPDASIICARLFHQGEPLEPATQDGQWVADFAGGASTYRKEAFLATSGYIPLTIAYGMEEVDLAIRFHTQNRKILRTNWLRVFHDTTLDRHANPRITAVSIANIALLTFLRYPILLWPIGWLQILSRMIWLINHQRFRGIGTGLLMIPAYLWKYKQFRNPVSLNALLSYLALRRNPTPLEPNGTEISAN